MNQAVKKITDHLAQKPRTLFLIDSAGALLSALLLLAALRYFSPHIGMPKTVLKLLWSAAGCFFFYSACCFLLLRERWAVFIRIIGFANALYCVLTLALIFLHYKGLTPLGLAYFTGETALICALACIELQAAAKIKKIR